MCEIATSASLSHYPSSCLTPFGRAGNHHSSVIGVCLCFLWGWIVPCERFDWYRAVELSLSLTRQVRGFCFLSVFQSESEQDEEGTGSMGSASVAVSQFTSFPTVSEEQDIKCNRSKSRNCWSQCRVIMGVSHHVTAVCDSVVCRKQIRGCGHCCMCMCVCLNNTLLPPLCKLDPIEKEWIYSAAGARVPDLSQLLRQDSSLANKKVAPPSAWTSKG